MSISLQRLVIIILSLIFFAVAMILILVNAKNKIIFFFTPTELLNSVSEINTVVRIGGFVKKNSLEKNHKNNIYNFTITDHNNDVQIQYKGILPDLFNENQGAVVEGVLIQKKKILASKIFAKHDENYMPASIEKQLKETDYWKKNY